MVDERGGGRPTTADLFEFDAICLAGRGDRTRLRDLHLSIPDHAITVVLGPSGSGKSSLLRLCNRLEAPDTGTVRFRGTDLATVDPQDLRRRVAMLFQRPVTFPGTGRDNLREADPDATDERFAELLGMAGLDESFLDRVADELSGGQAQRLCLARALATRPEVLLADEATSALDRAATAAIERLVSDLAVDGIPLVWVTHDLDQARRLADHLVVIRDGSIAHAGPADALDRDVPDGLLSLLDDAPDTDGETAP